MKVVPTPGHPQTWPISISAHLLAPFPDPTMHNMYICQKMSGCVRKCEVGARGVCLWPFWHHFAPFWQANGASPNLLQSCHILVRCNMLTQTMLPFPIIKFCISGLFLSTPLGFCCFSVQHMCALARSHAYLYDHHACTKVGHSPIAPS